MHYIILYNPLSKGGSNKKICTKLKRYLEKANHDVEIGSLLDISDVKEYINNLDEETKIIIVGGDGTIHHLANALIDYDVKNEIFAVKKAGTGNDFIRSLKSKDKLIKINEYIKHIPYDLVHEDEKIYFVNSLGMGVDAYIGYIANTYENSKGKWTYFKSVYKGFSKFKPFKLSLELDGKKKEFKNTWLAVVANSPYFGGGMKISPKANRNNDDLEVVVIYGLKKFFVLMLFPLIYFGLHTIFKRWVKVYKTKHIKFETDIDMYLQYDGETLYPRRKAEVYIRNKKTS